MEGNNGQGRNGCKVKRNLNALIRGEYAYIDQVDGENALSRRLADLGFVPGTRVECELVSPAGDPAAYRIRGALIALRRRDAGRVWVTEGAVS